MIRVRTLKTFNVKKEETTDERCPPLGWTYMQQLSLTEDAVAELQHRERESHYKDSKAHNI